MAEKSTNFEKFIKTGFGKDDRAEFGRNALEAALEIAQEEGSEILALHGSVPSELPDNWLPADFSAGEKSKTQLSYAISEWRESGKAILFRGTNLPDAKIGSFQFPGDAVHMTLDFPVALGYAGAINPDRHQILSLGDNQGKLGFLTVWEAPLDTKLWSNFHYEDHLNGRQQASKLTIGDALNSFEEIANRPVAEHELTTDGNYHYHSKVSAEVGELLKYKYYEAVAGDEAGQTAIYLNSPKGLIKINPENPKWDLWMTRVQEASLRDIYEISPLQRMEAELKVMVSNAEHFKDDVLWQQRSKLAQKYLDSGYLQLVRSQSEDRSWQYKSMSEMHNAEMPWLKSSSRVASSTGASLVYAENVREFVNLSGNYAEIDSFLESWSKAIAINAPLREERESLASREKTHVKKLEQQREGAEPQISRGGKRSEPAERKTWADSV